MRSELFFGVLITVDFTHDIAVDRIKKSEFLKTPKIHLSHRQEGGLSSILGEYLNHLLVSRLGLEPTIK